MVCFEFESQVTLRIYLNCRLCDIPYLIRVLLLTKYFLSLVPLLERNDSQLSLSFCHIYKYMTLRSHMLKASAQVFHYISFSIQLEWYIHFEYNINVFNSHKSMKRDFHPHNSLSSIVAVYNTSLISLSFKI